MTDRQIYDKVSEHFRNKERGFKFSIDNGQRTEQVELVGQRRCKCSNPDHNRVVFKSNSGKQIEMSFRSIHDMLA